jgi:hypothetical protein
MTHFNIPSLNQGQRILERAWPQLSLLQSIHYMSSKNVNPRAWVSTSVWSVLLSLHHNHKYSPLLHRHELKPERAASNQLNIRGLKRTQEDHTQRLKLPPILATVPATTIKRIHLVSLPRRTNSTDHPPHAGSSFQTTPQTYISRNTESEQYPNQSILPALYSKSLHPSRKKLSTCS